MKRYYLEMGASLALYMLVLILSLILLREPADMGLLLRTEKSVLFVIPWGRHWIVGTTDTDWDLDKLNPSSTTLTSEPRPWRKLTR